MKKNTSIVNVGARALVFGGSYGNLQATQAILEFARSNGFCPESTIFTGDLVAYCGQPQETTDLIRTFGCHTVKGNCEESLAKGHDDCGCGFDEGTECNLLSAQWFSFCQKSLAEETKHWMGTLPVSLNIKIGDYSLFCTHGTTESINQFVFPSEVSNGTYSIPQNLDFDGYIVGHSGIPFIGEQSNRFWINSGAAGMPANDGTSRVWVATLEATGSALNAELHGLVYDQESAGQAMTDAGLVNGYQTCLSTGIWPSHDVLPNIERAQTGLALSRQKKALHRTPFSEPIERFA